MKRITMVLSKTKAKVKGPDGAAALLGINPSTFGNRMRKLGFIMEEKVNTAS